MWMSGFTSEKLQHPAKSLSGMPHRFIGKEIKDMKIISNKMILALMLFSLQVNADNFGYLYIFKVNIPLKRAYYINPSSEGTIRFNSVDYIDSLGFLMFKVDSVTNNSLCPKSGIELAPGVVMENKIDKHSKVAITYICDTSVGIMISNEDPFLQDLLDTLKKPDAHNQ